MLIKKVVICLIFYCVRVDFNLFLNVWGEQLMSKVVSLLNLAAVKGKVSCDECSRYCGSLNILECLD